MRHLEKVEGKVYKHNNDYCYEAFLVDDSEWELVDEQEYIDYKEEQLKLLDNINN